MFLIFFPRLFIHFLDLTESWPYFKDIIFLKHLKCFQIKKISIIHKTLEIMIEIKRWRHKPLIPGMKLQILQLFKRIIRAYCEQHWASLVAQTVKTPPAMWETWVGKIPWRRAWQPAAVFLPGESHGQRSLAGCTPRGHRESGTTEQLSTHKQLYTTLPRIGPIS